MRKVMGLFLVLSLSVFMTNCSSKKKKTEGTEGISILQPDGGTPNATTEGITMEGMPTDATSAMDPALSLAVSGSDTGKFQGLYTVNFEYDRARLTDEARALLASNVDWIRSNPSKVVQLEGHCDERGSTEYNLALGDRRARSVKEYLVSLGIDGNRLIVISYGKEKLLSMGGTEIDHSKNRRVNFLPIDQ